MTRDAADDEESGRAWLRGSVPLARDTFVGVVNIVHGMHRAIARSSNRLNPAYRPGRQVSDFVYGQIRDIGRLSFFGVRQLAGLGETFLPARAEAIPPRLSLSFRSALNGAFGDYMDKHGNALALPMVLIDDAGGSLPFEPEAMAAALRQPQKRLVLLVHGLGMNDQQWRQGGRADFGDRLSADFNFTALRLRYNSGRHISENGQALAALLERLYTTYPVPLERLTIIGHSMGGLVARSAIHYGREADHSWVDRLAEVVCLGSPHLGAPLERLGDRFTRLLTLSPYTRPLSMLGEIRSSGVKDLRHGYLVDEQWRAGARRPAPAQPAHAADEFDHFLVAGILGRAERAPLGRWLGDLMVPVKSAVGHAASSGQGLSRAHDGRVFYGMSHFALMYHDDVYTAIAEWLRQRLPAVDSRFFQADIPHHERSRIQ